MSAQRRRRIERAVTAAGDTLVVYLRGALARAGPRGGAPGRATALATSRVTLGLPSLVSGSLGSLPHTMHRTRAAFVARYTSGGERCRMKQRVCTGTLRASSEGARRRVCGVRGAPPPRRREGTRGRRRLARCACRPPQGWRPCRSSGACRAGHSPRRPSGCPPRAAACPPRSPLCPVGGRGGGGGGGRVRVVDCVRQRSAAADHSVCKSGGGKLTGTTGSAQILVRP